VKTEERRENVRFQLPFEERIVLRYLQEEQQAAISLDRA